MFFAGGYAIRLQDDLAMSKSRFGWAVSAYFVTSAVASFTVGGWIDRYGSRVGFVAAAGGGAIAAAGVAVSGSFTALAVALGVAGLANTAGQVAANRALADVGPKRQGPGFGLKQAAVPFGGLCAGLVVGSIGGEIGWRAAFAAYAVLALVIAAMAPAGLGAASTERQPTAVGRDWPFLLTLAAAGSLGGATGNALAVLTVDAFGAAGYGEGVGAAALAIGSAITIAARIGVGSLAGRRNTSGIVELAGAMAIGAAGFAVLAGAGSSGGLLWAGVLLAFLGAWGWPGVMYYSVVRGATTQPGTSTGLVAAGVFLGGIVGAPLLAGIAERWSYSSAWTTAAVMTLVATGLTWLAGGLAVRVE